MKWFFKNLDTDTKIAWIVEANLKKKKKEKRKRKRKISEF